MMDFVRFMIRNKELALAVFFISLGMFSFISYYKSNEN